MNDLEARLRTLSQREGDPAISLFAGRATPGTDGEKARITLENLLSQARSALEDRPAREREALLEPLEPLLDEVRVTGWGSVAAFRTDDQLDVLHLRSPVAPRVDVAPRFRLAPLIPEADLELEVLVVALSLENVRVFRADLDRLERVPLSNDVPTRLEAALGTDTERASLRHHSTGPGGAAVRFAGSGRGGEGGGFHAPGGAADDHKDEVRTFLDRLSSALGKEDLPDLPIVLAGVEFETATFRKATSLPRLVDAEIQLSPDGVTDPELHAAAKDVIAHLSRLRREEAWHRLSEPRRFDHVALELDDVLRSGFQGKIAELFVDPDAEVRGRFEPETLGIELQDDGPDELVNRAVCATLRHGGRVYPMPNGSTGPVKALKRFP